MDPRLGIGALAVAALMAASPASAQSNAKPAVGTVIGVQSGVNACPPGDRVCRVTQTVNTASTANSSLRSFTTLRFVMIGGVITVVTTRYAIQNRSNPSSP